MKDPKQWVFAGGRSQAQSSSLMPEGMFPKTQDLWAGPPINISPQQLRYNQGYQTSELFERSNKSTLALNPAAPLGYQTIPASVLEDPWVDNRGAPTTVVESLTQRMQMPSDRSQVLPPGSKSSIIGKLIKRTSFRSTRETNPSSPSGSRMPSDGPMINPARQSKATGKYAGMLLAAGQGLAIAGGAFDIYSLTKSNQQGEDEARDIARQFVKSGFTDYGSIMALAQSNPELERKIGNIGASDYAKTIAGIGLQAVDFLTGGPLGLVTAPIGAVAQIDMQRDKAARNRAFRDEFEKALAGI
jgi:hypothetical protein